MILCCNLLENFLLGGADVRCKTQIIHGAQVENNGVSQVCGWIHRHKFFDLGNCRQVSLEIEAAHGVVVHGRRKRAII